MREYFKKNRDDSGEIPEKESEIDEPFSLREHQRLEAESGGGDGGRRPGVGLCLGDSSVEHIGPFDDFFSERRVHSSRSHWSIAWSDLMMTMFILFMVMFVYKAADREFLSGDGLGSFSGTAIGREVVAEGPGGANDFNAFGRRAYSKIYDFSRLTNLESDIAEFGQINLAPDNTLRIVLTGDLLFPSGGTSLRPDSWPLLKKIAIYLRESPYMIDVQGHTDNTPIRNSTTLSNWELSCNRASAVARYLIEKAHISAERFSVTGFGEYRPVAANDTPENRAKNRRVEIVLRRHLAEPVALPEGQTHI